MLRIFFEMSGNKDLTLGTFHSLEPLLNKSATIRSWSISIGGPNGRPILPFKIQRSCHTMVEFPSPITFPRLVTRRSRPKRTLIHPWDDDGVGGRSRKLLFCQYLPNRIRESRQSGVETNRQACLASKAILKSWISLIPRSPMIFGNVILLQAIQQIFFLSAESHQNLVSADWIRLHRLIGSSKQVLAWVGIADKTCLSIVWARSVRWENALEVRSYLRGYVSLFQQNLPWSIF